MDDLDTTPLSLSFSGYTMFNITIMITTVRLLQLLKYYNNHNHNHNHCISFYFYSLTRQ